MKAVTEGLLLTTIRGVNIYNPSVSLSADSSPCTGEPWTALLNFSNVYNLFTNVCIELGKHLTLYK